jgi:CheY-like chemotaxis protein
MKPPLKILLAEDDKDDRELFQEYLGHRNDIFLLPIVENGVEVWDLLHISVPELLPGLIILDQNMPMRNGLQTLRLLKTSPVFASIPVVIYSTYADESLVSDAIMKGAMMVVSKPLNRDGYQEMMNDFLLVLERVAEKEGTGKK